MGVIYRRKQCILCDSTSLKPVMRLRDCALPDLYLSMAEKHNSVGTFPLELCLCDECGQVQLQDIVDAHVLYDNNIYLTHLSPGLKSHFSEYAQTVYQRFLLSDNDLVVDLGCNDGVLLEYFKERGCRVLGIEPVAHVAKIASTLKIPVIQAYFDREVAHRIREDHGQAKIVTANNLIANVDDLQEFMLGVQKILSREGTFIFETGYLAKLIENKVFDNICHEHYSYFLVKPLHTFFAKIGMDLFDIEQIKTKGGSLRGYVQWAGGQQQKTDRVRKLIAEEEKEGFFQEDKYYHFSQFLETTKQALHQLLENYKDQRLVGYGASASVTTVLYHFELEKKLAFLIDDNPNKQGRYSPGAHLLVFSAEKIFLEEVKTILILPWRFQEQIVNRHQRFLKEGGHFITFLPEVAVI